MTCTEHDLQAEKEDDGADGGAGPLEGDVQGKTEDLSAKDIADMKQRAHDTGFQATDTAAIPIPGDGRNRGEPASAVRCCKQ